MKLNFFARIYLAITDFRLYPYVVQKEKFINALAYFIGFIALVSAILATGVTVKVINWANEFIVLYNANVTDFTIKDGMYSSNENMDFDFYGVRIYSDDETNVKDFNLENFDDKDCAVSLLILKDAMAIGTSNAGFVVTNYNSLNLNTDKQGLHSLLQYYFHNPIFKLSLASAILCAVFAAYLMTKFLNVIGITLMLLFLGFVFKTKYKFKHYMEVAFYVITLPIITEVLALVVTGSINEYAYITYYLLVYVYMYYAIRALKLDNIIMSAQEKIFGMRIENDTKVDENKDTTEQEDKKDSDSDESNKDNK